MKTVLKSNFVLKVQRPRTPQILNMTAPGVFVIKCTESHLATEKSISEPGEFFSSGNCSEWRKMG